MARERVSIQRIGLMSTAFLMITLIGVFATYAAPIPGIRGVIAEAAIAHAAASADPAAMKSALKLAKPLLGITGQKTLATLSPDRPGMASAATLVATDTAAGSALVSYRLRLMVIVIGVVAALFGIALLGIRDAAPSTTILAGKQPRERT